MRRPGVSESYNRGENGYYKILGPVDSLIVPEEGYVSNSDLGNGSAHILYKTSQLRLSLSSSILEFFFTIELKMRRCHFVISYDILVISHEATSRAAISIWYFCSTSYAGKTSRTKPARIS